MVRNIQWVLQRTCVLSGGLIMKYVSVGVRIIAAIAATLITTVLFYVIVNWVSEFMLRAVGV